MTSNATKILNILEDFEGQAGKVNDRPYYFDMDIWNHPSKDTSRYQDHPCGTAGCILGVIETFADVLLNPEEAADWLAFDRAATRELLLPSSNQFSFSMVTVQQATMAFKFVMDGGTAEGLQEYWEHIIVQS